MRSLRVGITPTPTIYHLVNHCRGGVYPRPERKRPSVIGWPFSFALCSLPYALLFLQCHLDIVARTLLGAKTASLAEIQIEFVQSSFRRDLNRIVRAIHETVATVETLSTAETSFRLIYNRLRIEWRV